MCDGLQLSPPRPDFLCTVFGTLSVNWHNLHCARTRAKCLSAWRNTSHPPVMSPAPTPRWIRAQQGLFQQWIWHVTMRTRYQIKQDWILGSYWNLKVVSTALGPQEAVQLVTPRVREAARNGSTCSAPSTGWISCCQSSIWTGCEAKPCQLFGKKQWSTEIQCADASSASRTRNRRAIFIKTNGSVIAIFFGGKSITSKSGRKLGNGSVIRSMGTRRASFRCSCRTQSSCTTPGRRYATTKSRIRWTT